VARRIVQRGEHDVEAREHLVWEVQRGVGQDLHLHAVRTVIPATLARTRSTSSRCCTSRSIVRVREAAVRSEWSGDRDVLIAQGTRRVDHGLDAVARVAPQRVRVQIALDVLQPHELGQPASAARATSSPPCRSSGATKARPSRA